MPTPQSSPNFDPQRFAALWAGFDTSNTNEAEAVGKARVLRRMAAAANLRVIDLLGRADVMQALDAQLAPQREPTAELRAAQEMAMEHCNIAKQAVAQAEHWAEVAKRQQQVIDELRSRVGSQPAPSGASEPANPASVYGAGFFAFFLVVGLAALIFCAVADLAAALLN